MEVWQMASSELEELIRRAKMLAPDEQLLLIARLAEKAREAYPGVVPRRHWREIYGVAPYPLLGEDAQEWVSRARREGDDHRGSAWGST